MIKFPNIILIHGKGHAMAQGVSRHPLSVEAWVSPCGICNQQKLSSSKFHYIFT